MRLGYGFSFREVGYILLFVRTIRKSRGETEIREIDEGAHVSNYRMRIM